MPRDYRVFLDDILEATRKVLEYTEGLSDEQFFGDRKTVEAVVWNLQIIGEATKNIPEGYVPATPIFPGGIWQVCGTSSCISISGSNST
jgi:uncharacterized protein with HEPN domain